MNTGEEQTSYLLMVLLHTSIFRVRYEGLLIVTKHLYGRDGGVYLDSASYLLFVE